MVWGADVGCWGCSGAAQGQQTGRSGPPEVRSVRSRCMARNRRAFCDFLAFGLALRALHARIV